MITIKIGTKTASVKDVSTRSGEDYYNVTATLADNTTDVAEIRATYEDGFDGTVTLPDEHVVSGLVITEVSRNYGESGVRTAIYLESASSVEE